MKMMRCFFALIFICMTCMLPMQVHAEEAQEYMTVTKCQRTSQMDLNTGRMYYVGFLELDGITAYCIERAESTPQVGSIAGERELVENENIRKVLYYGYKGPADCGYTYVETTLAAAEANEKGDGAGSMGERILSEISTMEIPPEDFYVWKVETNGGETQDLVFYTYDVICVELTKYNTDFIGTLAGAKFAHTNPDGTVDIQVTDENGKIIWEKLSQGTHLIEELEAPTGYIRNQNIITFVVNENKQIEVTSQVDSTSGNVTTVCDAAGNLQIAVENKNGYQLPNTGSSMEVSFRLFGLGLLAIAFRKGKRRETI